MLQTNAEQILRQFSEETYQKQLIQINPRIHVAIAYGHSNCTIIEGESSIILVDTLDSDTRALRLREEIEALIPGKPIKTLIYTHRHNDHIGGSSAFADCAERIIASSMRKESMLYTDRLKPVFGKRATKQFGHRLTDEETITQGIGIRAGIAVNDGKQVMLPPTELFIYESEEYLIDGVRLQLISAPGETDDQLYVYLPDDKVLCCGDNYYACWPNLYAIRGSQYRDIAAWVDSLRKILEIPAEILIPGHTQVLYGKDVIQERIRLYSDAIDSILQQTLDCIAKDFTIEETVETVQLPEEYGQLPFLREFYGTIDWSIRAIYTGYLGWFDGNPTSLNPLPRKEHAEKMIALIGTSDRVVEAIQQAMREEAYQWGLELCDLLLHADEHAMEAAELKAQCMMQLAKLELSANGRHYYIADAHELRKKYFGE